MKKLIGLAVCLAVCLALLPACAMLAAPAAGTQADALPTLDAVCARGGLWRYVDDPLQLSRIDGLSWTLPGFDDSLWLTAEGWSFGADHGRLIKLDGGFLPEVCLRQYMPDGRNIPVYYFRLPFTVDDEAEKDALTVSLAYDDALIVYLNGEEVFSGNVPEGGYEGPNAFGSADVLGEPREVSFELDASLLTRGENVLAFELHQDNDDSSDVYFGVESIRTPGMRYDALRGETVCLGVGADDTSVLTTWRGAAGKEAYVQVGAAGGFPENALRYDAAAVYADGDVCTYRAEISGLEPGTYAYRVVDAAPSETREFTLSDPSDGFSFLCHGDPQIADEDDTKPIEIYDELAARVAGSDPMQFVLSLGDQSDEKDEEGLFERFTGASLIKRVPLAPVVGNHEFHSDTFSRFFYMPNMDEETLCDSGDMSGDYWFFRGNLLVFCLNSDCDDVEVHRAFMLRAREACARRYGEPAWTVAAMHYSMFSQGEHSADSGIVATREEYAQAFQEAGVRAVFSGHDHMYTRSWPIDGGVPVIGGESREGVVFFCLGSSTGTKFYDPVPEKYDYAAMSDASENPCMTRVDVTQDAMVVTTYCERDGSLEVLDTYRIEDPAQKAGA